jgi:putative transposase
MPDHLHCVLTLPADDSDFSTRLRLIKKRFSMQYAKDFKQAPGASRKKKREVMVWQRRFWEHLIRDETDLRRHVEYIHYNPVKHGLTTVPKEWPYSSFHRYVRLGKYTPDWGGHLEIEFTDDIGGE